ncbi:DNA-directed DNA polymerase gamma mip1 [Lobosporangium transversale]|uniref:DNA-directed DNA polymerase n=1 Tax=Lobosporangium transversale TaxID=64571 RepID=A0A1Y2GI28_9FUNG|nr:DNA polymerase family A-domain-containing protein [Lobosporangium transversale]KAF9918775.1 DNA-directed DNA polymerase gamma mip1 [Lobosporangium transversale]ORZ09715.1 DNA polymerase family A-domain-containing protein [Lobosporangium transversale]|eukprot:XP_021878985.1 DNA polymerase family A-domain-containing protein [Lobosporangium transversale]
MAQHMVPRQSWRCSVPVRTFSCHSTPLVTRPCSRTSTFLSQAATIPVTTPSTKVLWTSSCIKARHHTLPPSYGLIHSRLLSTSGSIPEPRPLRKNKVDVQMLHPELHSKVFPFIGPSSTVNATKSANNSETAVENTTDPTPEMIQCAITHLKKQNLWGKEPILVPDIAFDLPELRGKTIEDHFYNIGVFDSATYKEMALQFAQSSIPPLPKQWDMRAGWTRYGEDGSIKQVEYPRERILTFDVETVPGLSKYPVLATAVSSEAWYGWVSPWIINPTLNDGLQNDCHLISFGPNRNMKGEEKILVGHNVGYDRARVLEEYCMEQNGIRYLDTMSLHVAVSGLCTQQRPSWLKYSKAIERDDEAYVHACKDTTGKYFDVSSVNSLAQVAKFHCDIKMDKATRNILMEATDISLVQENFQALMEYCGNDVIATHAVYRQTLPKYFQTCPHPVSFAGILQMGSSFLTVNEGWTAYIARCNKMYSDMAKSVESKLLMLAEKAVENFEKDPELYASDPWLSQLDWNKPQRVWFEGKLRANGKGYLKGQEPRWKCRAKLLTDKPEWYRALWSPEEQRVKLSTRQRVAPLLLKLQWKGYPLVHSTLHGWTFRVPIDDQGFVTKTEALVFPAENEAGHQSSIDPTKYRYYRVPHNGGEGMNVGNPLSKGFMSYFEDNVLGSYAAEGESSDDGSGQLAKQALDMNAQCAYWVSSRERIEDQFVVWDKGQGGLGDRMRLPDRGEGLKNGIILPQIITMGTVTRRAVEKTWMTASNAKKNRIGSELKSMVQAPKGYKIVGADVDSEELWISSLMGDAQLKMHGATALGWMTLQGTKSAETDLHSKTAQILGISRDQAKVFNYGRIYGAGVKFAARLMQQFNTTIEAAEAKQRAINLYAATKGIKEQKAIDYELVTDRPFWHGGSESYMFNSLERTATAEDPRTPALSCGITDALKPKYTESQFMTSRVNWVVQSSGVDYLHMLLVSMNYLIRKYDIKARFMLCVHDEVRYMVKEEDTARATLALQISNLWTRAMFSYKLGIHDLPQSVAFFSSVDVDHVFRKEVNMDCITPTQQIPIAHGHSLTIEGVLALTDGGKLGPVVEGFRDAGEDPIPSELRTIGKRQKVQASKAIYEDSRNSVSQELNFGKRMFLEAQSMSTLSEIKEAIKQKKTQAETALKAKREAELRAASGTGNYDEGSTNGPFIRVSKTKAAATPRRRVSTIPRSVHFGPMVSGSWGIKTEQIPPTTCEEATSVEIINGSTKSPFEPRVCKDHHSSPVERSHSGIDTHSGKKTKVCDLLDFEQDDQPADDLLRHFAPSYVSSTTNAYRKPMKLPIHERRVIMERQAAKDKKVDTTMAASSLSSEGFLQFGARSVTSIVPPSSAGESIFRTFSSQARRK